MLYEEIAGFHFRITGVWKPYQQLFSVPRLIGREFSAKTVVYTWRLHNLNRCADLR